MLSGPQVARPEKVDVVGPGGPLVVPYKCGCVGAKGWADACKCNSAEWPHDCNCHDDEGHFTGYCKCNSPAWPHKCECDDEGDHVDRCPSTAARPHKCGCTDDEGNYVYPCPSTCGLPCGEVWLEDGGVWPFATPHYPIIQFDPPWASWCLCEWIIHAPAGKNLSLALDQSGFDISDYFFVSKRGGGEDVPLTACGGSGTYPASLCDGVVASGSLHIGLYTGAYALSLNVTATAEPASEPLNSTVLNGLSQHGRDMMECRCPDGDLHIYPGNTNTVKSPGFQHHNLYPNLCNCFWLIEAPSECKVSVEAEDFSIDTNSFDFLATYDVVGSSLNSSLRDLASCTGDSCELINSTSNRMALVFVSDWVYTDKGFSLAVQTTGCTACDVAPPCENGGTCRSEGANALCTCPSGYSGLRCETVVDACLAYGYNCENGGTCTAEREKPCICAPGYSGMYCGTVSDACLAYKYNCRNGGTCIPTDPKPWCKCVVGYSGVYFETIEDRCAVAKDNCLNGTTPEAHASSKKVFQLVAARRSSLEPEVSIPLLVLLILTGAGGSFYFWRRSKGKLDQEEANGGDSCPPDPSDTASVASGTVYSEIGYEVPLGRLNRDAGEYAHVDYGQMRDAPTPPPIELMPKHRPQLNPATVKRRMLSWGFREEDNGIVPDCARPHRPLTGYTDALPNTMFTPSEIEDASREAQQSSPASDFTASDATFTLCKCWRASRMLVGLGAWPTRRRPCDLVNSTNRQSDSLTVLDALPHALDSSDGIGFVQAPDGIGCTA